MTSCPLPSQLAALVPTDIANPSCDEIKAILMQWTSLMAQNQACMFNEDGSLNVSFAYEICHTACGGTDTNTSTA
jgi:hypothetical protein